MTNPEHHQTLFIYKYIYFVLQVPPDMLDLRVPVWVSDLTYMPDNRTIAVVSRHKCVSKTPNNVANDYVFIFINNTTKAVINILSFNFFSKSFQSSSLDHFSITNHRNNFLKWLSYSKTSILDTTLKLKYHKIIYYLHKNKKKSLWKFILFIFIPATWYFIDFNVFITMTFRAIKIVLFYLIHLYRTKV